MGVGRFRCKSYVLCRTVNRISVRCTGIEAAGEDDEAGKDEVSKILHINESLVLFYKFKRTEELKYD
jgi:hypothetical protein